MERHGHHPEPVSDVEARVRALESLLYEQGLITPEAVDTLVSAYESDIGPLNGARVVARAWVDPDGSGSEIIPADPEAV